MEFYENCAVVETFASKKDIVLVLENIISEVSCYFLFIISKLRRRLEEAVESQLPIPGF